MQRIIIIDDTNCKPLLEDFLKILNEHVKYDVRIGDNPLQKQLMLDCINESPAQKKITVKSEGNIYLINCYDIARIEAKGGKSTLCLNDHSSLLTDDKIDDWQMKLEDFGFLRVHPKYLVNINDIVKLEFGKTPVLELTGGEEIPVDIEIQHKVAGKLENLLL